MKRFIFFVFEAHSLFPLSKITVYRVLIKAKTIYIILAFIPIKYTRNGSFYFILLFLQFAQA